VLRALLLLAPVTSFVSFSSPLRRDLSSARYASYSDRDLKKMTLKELKDAAGELGITEPEGHKGRKATWLQVIKAAAPAAEPKAKAAEQKAKAAEPKAKVASKTTAKSAPVPAPAAPNDTSSGVKEPEDFIASHPAQLGTFQAICQPGAPAESFVKTLANGAAPPPLATLKDPVYSDADRTMLAETLDFMQTSMLTFGDEDADPEEDADFIAEGRRIMAIGRFVIKPLSDESELVAAVFEELGGLVAPVVPSGMDPSEFLAGEEGRGTMILCPGYSGGDVRGLVARLEPVVAALGLAPGGRRGFGVELKAYRMAEGAPAPMVRVLFEVDTRAVERPEGEKAPSAEDLVDGNALVRELAQALKADDDAKAQAGKEAETEAAEATEATAKDEAKAKEQPRAKEQEPKDDEGPKDLADRLMNFIDEETLKSIYKK